MKRSEVIGLIVVIVMATAALIFIAEVVPF